MYALIEILSSQTILLSKILFILLSCVLCLGNCLQASKGNLTLFPCVGFSSGCPKTSFKSSDFYKCKKFKRCDLHLRKESNLSKPFYIQVLCFFIKILRVKAWIWSTIATKRILNVHRILIRCLILKPVLLES